MNNVQILEKTGDFFSSQSVFPPLTVQISLSVSAFGLRGGIGNIFYWIRGNFCPSEDESLLKSSPEHSWQI